MQRREFLKTGSAALRPGEYKLSIGLLKSYNMKPAILFANKDNDDSKWLVLKGKTLSIKA